MYPRINKPFAIIAAKSVVEYGGGRGCGVEAGGFLRRV